MDTIANHSVWWLRDAIEILRANGSHDHVKHLSALLAEHTDMLEALQYCQQSLLYMTRSGVDRLSSNYNVALATLCEVQSAIAKATQEPSVTAIRTAVTLSDATDTAPDRR